jgi:hypothetical protein
LAVDRAFRSRGIRLSWIEHLHDGGVAPFDLFELDDFKNARQARPVGDLEAEVKRPNPQMIDPLTFPRVH